MSSIIENPVTIHEANTTTFRGIGLGCLSAIISGTVVEEINGEYECEFKYNVFGLNFNLIKHKRIIYVKPTPYKKPQPFRIYAISTPIDGVVTVNAAHISYDLSGYPVSEFEAKSITDAVSKLKSSAILACPFNFNTNKTDTGDLVVEKPVSIRSVIGRDIIDTYGGEIEFDGFDVNIKKNRGVTTATTIRYGKNLLDINQEENSDNMYTGVYPFWYSKEDGYVRLPEKVINLPGTHNFTKIYVLDTSSYFSGDGKPTEEQVREVANTFISTNELGVPNMSLDLSYIQQSKDSRYTEFESLEELGLGDIVNVEFIDANINSKAKCVRTEYDILTDEYSKLDFGDVKSNISNTIADGLGALNDKVENQYIQFDAEIGSIKIDLAVIDTAIIGKADIDWVEANYAHIKDGVIDNAVIGDATITSAKIANAAIITAHIADATITSAKIANASINTAHIDTLDAKVITAHTITSEQIQAGGITSDSLTVADGFIKDAMIASINANKINAGEINTNKVKISSQNGAIEIADSTQQFRDKNGKVRIQMGQDAKGEFNFGIFDETGVGVLIDATGIKEKAIADGLIKENMIGDGEIGGAKIDISSMISEVNKDTNSTLLKGTKVYLDTEKQTLEVAFKQLSTETDDNREITNSHTTKLELVDGQIVTLIRDTTVEENGVNIKLKDAYSSLKQTVDGITSTVSNNSSSITTIEGQVKETIKNVDVMYALSASTTIAPTTGWQTTAPTWVEGKYMWSKTVTTFLTGFVKESAPTCIAGATGKGVKSIVEQYYLSGSTTSLIGGSWVTTPPAWVNGKYTWTRSIVTYTDNSTVTTEPVCVSGSKGDQGVPGIQGPQGQNGETLYTWVKYADTSTGSGMSDLPDGKKYIGFAYNKNTPTESSTASDYTWSLIQGAQGVQGADGKTYYTWLKYADTPTSGMSDSPDGKKYMGVAYNKTTSTESTNYSDYQWSLIKGDKGDKGDTGNGISSVDVEYYLSTSSTSLSGGSWSTNAPAWVDGKYMWSRTKTVDTSGTTTYTNPVCITGGKGNTGSTGATGAVGTGIDSITEEYYLSTSKTEQVGGSWVTTPPTWSTGKYMWTRSKIIYKNPTSTVYTTPVCDSSWEAVNDIQVGGRNLWINSKIKGSYAIEKLGDNHITGQTECYKIKSGEEFSFMIEPDYSSRLYKQLVFSAWVKCENVVQGANSWNKFNIFKHSLNRKNSTTGATTATDFLTLGGLLGTTDWIKVEYTYDYSSNTSYDQLKTSLRFNLESVVSGNAWITGIKVEFGNKATDWTPAPEDVDSSLEVLSTKVTTVENKQSSLEQDLSSFKTTVSSTYSTKTEVTTVDGKVKSLDTRVSTAESSIIQLDNKIALKVEANDVTNIVNNAVDGIQIGGRNLMLNSKSGSFNSFGGGTNVVFLNRRTNIPKGTKPGEYLTISLRVKYTNIVLVSGKESSANFKIQGSGNVTAWNPQITPSDNLISKFDKGQTSEKIFTHEYSFQLTSAQLTNDYFDIGFRADYIQSGTVIIEERKVELGNKATDWSPAPEDVDDSISNVQTQITTTSNKVATIETNLDNITQRVSSTESSTVALTTKLNDTTNIANTALDNSNKIPGGTNLLRNGNFEFVLDNWIVHDMSNNTGTNKSIGTTSSGDWCPVGKRILQIKGTSVNGRYGVMSSSMLLMPDTEYTISGYCSGHRVGKIQVNVRDNDNGDANIKSYDYDAVTGGTSLDKWRRFELTFKTTGNKNFSINLYSINLGDNGYVWFSDVQLQQGNKATAWTKCQADYDAKTNELTASITTTNNKVSSIETNLNSITSRVSSVETTTSNINGDIKSLQTRMSTAEQKITDSAIINTVSNTINSAKNEAINSANNSTDNKLTQYSTKSEVKQTANDVTFKFSQSGGQNVIKNGKFKNGYSMWSGWGTPPTADIGNWNDKGAESDTAYHVITNQSNQGRSQDVTGLSIGTPYTIRARMYVNNGQPCIMFKRNNTWWTWLWPESNGYKKWHTIVFEYTPNSSTDTIYIGKSGAGVVGEYYFTNISMTKGVVKDSNGNIIAPEYMPHPSEIYEGSTVIDGSGVTINNGAIEIKNNKGNTVMKCDSDGWLNAGNLFITGSESPSNLEIGGQNGNKGLAIRTNSSAGTVYLDFAMLPKETSFDAQVASGGFHRIVSQEGSRDTLRIVGRHLDIKAFEGAADVTIQGKLSTSSSINTTNTVHANGVSTVNLSVSGSKNCNHQTDNYGNRLINAYETAEYYFGDLGEGIIQNGECVVYIDEVFKDCVNTKISYHIFTQVYNGAITSIKRYEDYFVIRGIDGTEFSWEIKAKRKGYEYDRLEIGDEVKEVQMLDDLFYVMDLTFTSDDFYEPEIIDLLEEEMNNDENS